MTDQEKLKIAAKALEQSIGGQAACLRAVELTLEALRGDVPAGWVDSVMEQAQVFASAWSLVGGRFDFGSAAEDAEAAKNELRAMLEAAPQPAAKHKGRFAGIAEALALAQPATQQEPSGEPVAFVQSLDKPSPRCVTDLKYCTIAEHDNGDHLKYIPLYTRPAVPLTDEQIKQVFDNLPSAHEKAWFIRYARAIEAAHKIGGAE